MDFLLESLMTLAVILLSAHWFAALIAFSTLTDKIGIKALHVIAAIAFLFLPLSLLFYGLFIEAVVATLIEFYFTALFALIWDLKRRG